MAELSKGHVYNPGDVVDAADLNNLVDAATALKGIILDQPSTAPVAADDSVLFYDLSATDLARCKISALPSGTTSVDWDASNPAPTAIFSGNVSPTTGDAKITLGLKNQGAGKVLAGPVSGSAATPAFRVLSPADLPVATIPIALAAIDWNLGVMFSKVLTGNITFTFTGASAGQTIRVLVRQDTSAPPPRTVTWPTVRWPGGTNPVMTTTAGAFDLYTFHFISGLYFGTFEQNFLP